MSLYRAYFVPGDMDPEGSIVVTTLIAEKLDCGGRKVRWKFSLSNDAPCDGYIVQEIIQLNEVNDCTNCPTSTSLTPTNKYWEAWYVKKGDKLSWDTVRDGWTDGSGRPSRPGTCGYNVSLGKLKFFCKAPLKPGEPATGDIGDFGRDPVGHPGDWQTENPNTGAGGLPSTTTPPPWWNKTPIEGTSSRFASSYWNCCDCETEKHNDLGVSPAKGGGDVWQ